MNKEEINTKIKQLPDHLADEVNDYIDFLISKYGKEKQKKPGFKFDWEGGLSELKDKFSSVDLQHKASEWR